jgi:hypothetical protein
MWAKAAIRNAGVLSTVPVTTWSFVLEILRVLAAARGRAAADLRYH